MAANASEVIRAYQSILGRLPSAADQAYWEGAGLNEFAAAAAPEAVNSAYWANFGRPAEQSGSDYWVNQAAGNDNYDYVAAIGAGALGADVIARNDIAAGGVDINRTWSNGANLANPNLNYDAENNTWGEFQAPAPAPVYNYPSQAAPAVTTPAPYVPPPPPPAQAFRNSYGGGMNQVVDYRQPEMDTAYGDDQWLIWDTPTDTPGTINAGFTSPGASNTGFSTAANYSGAVQNGNQTAMANGYATPSSWDARAKSRAPTTPWF
jgi:hypothetical protein